MTNTITMDEHITVGNLADKLSIPVSKLITELMKNGVMATVNESIDFDTAQIIIGELGLDFKLTQEKPEKIITTREHLKTQKNGELRPPIVAVMGHVDHGKTSLLDAIRESDVVNKEHGGITQHISAYQITYDNRAITFIDTPGHEAFAALREHGAKLTDLVIIVIAADDGVKPQTVEAIRFAKEAKVKIIIAINKIDKASSDTSKIKQQLADQNILVEGWGGETVVVEVSAKTKQGIKQLLDMVMLVADVEELKAIRQKPARGLIIEAHMEKGRGPVAVGLIDEGTLNNGDCVVAGTTYAKIRNLESTDGSTIKTATPSMPVLITGFKDLPDFGDEFSVVSCEKDAREAVQMERSKHQKHQDRSNLSGSDLIKIINKTHELTELNVVVKADVQGSVVTVIDSLKTLNSEEVAIRIVGSGVGSVTENDIHLAHTSQAIIYGFNVTIPNNIKRLAARDKVPTRLFAVIYELIDDAKAELSKLLTPDVVEHELGQLLVKGVFKITKTEIICGGEVTKGKLSVPAQARIMRGKETIAETMAVGLQKAQQAAKEIIEGEMCGINLKAEGKVDLKEGDTVTLYTKETVTRTL